MLAQGFAVGRKKYLFYVVEQAKNEIGRGRLVTASAWRDAVNAARLIAVVIPVA